MCGVFIKLSRLSGGDGGERVGMWFLLSVTTGASRGIKTQTLKTRLFSSIFRRHQRTLQVYRGQTTCPRLASLTCGNWFLLSSVLVSVLNLRYVWVNY